MKYLQALQPDDVGDIARVFAELEVRSDEVREKVRQILDAVHTEGDAACVRFTKALDGVSISASAFEITAEERRLAAQTVAPELRGVLAKAAANIHFFHEKQRVADLRTERAGVVLEQRVLPMARVGVYIPGGRALYPSTVLMTAIPAKIAGVAEVIMVSPPDRVTGQISPVLLVAAEIAGVDRVFRLGGAQAVGALAFGTATIPAVDKIVGPGNAYVAEAKRQVFGRVGIDMLAGPTEVAIWVDETASAAVVAQDLFAQMEHDPSTRALVVATQQSVLQNIARYAESALAGAPRVQILREAWGKNTCFVYAASEELAARVIDTFAPEHLQLMTRMPRALLPMLHHAGAIFLGHFSPVAMGDYVAGPNHTLPTNGCARFASPLGVYDFVRHQDIIEYSREGWAQEYRDAAKLARAEGLINHALSVEMVRKGAG